MFMQGRVLSREEKQIIHDKSIEILQEVGVKVPLESALALLEKGGATIDWDKEKAYITADMVKKALASMPKEFVLGARNSAYDFHLPSAYSTVNLDGCGVNIRDFNTGEKRLAGLQDIADSARIFEEVELGSFMWPPIAAFDAPAGARGIMGTGTALIHTSKHVQDEIKNIKELPYLLEMIKAIAGSEEELRRRHMYSVTYCTVAPLSHDGEMLEATMALAEYELPVLVYPMPACGSTGPASLYSNVAMSNAEALSALVIFNLVNPATPLIYGAALGSINMRSGLFLEGAAETIVQLMATGEMGKYYGLPTIIAGCITDAKIAGMQSIFEKTITSLPLVMAGVDVVQGIGLVESSMTLSLEHIIIDGMIADVNRKLAEGMKISEEYDFIEDIKAVGSEGHFLKRPNTRKAFRSGEFTAPELLDRDSYDEWLNLGSPDLISKSREKVQSILSSEMKNPMDANTEKIIGEIMKEAAAKL